jgi:hypothetical protein
MNRTPRKAKLTLKRTLCYDEGDEEPLATKARIDDSEVMDGENLQNQDHVETGTGDPRECARIDMITD